MVAALAPPDARRSRYSDAGLELLRETGRDRDQVANDEHGRRPRDDNGNATAVEVPWPRSAPSFAVLAHEVAHVVLRHDFVGGKRRYAEEVEAWEYTINAVLRFGLGGEDNVEALAASRIGYAFDKAIRRGRPAWAIAEEFPVWWDRYERAA